jgi:glutamine synthetase
VSPGLGGVGRSDFVRRHGLRRDGDEGAAEQAERVIDEHGIDLVRLSFADPHGILRGKTVTSRYFEAALDNGYTLPATLVAKDTSHRTVYPIFHRSDSALLAPIVDVSDVVLVPDPTTFRLLPWAPRTGWALCDVYFTDGRPVPFSTRAVCRDVLDDLTDRGFDLVVGLEVEFYVFRLEDAALQPERSGQPADPPTVSLLNHGYQLMTEQRLDQLDDVVRLVTDTVSALDIPLRSVEMEFGPSQLEVTFGAQTALEAADNMVLFRSAVKQACRRHGYLATFMCRPNLPNLFSSGWHLHQSLRTTADGTNAFMPGEDDDGPLSPTGRAFLGGLLEHAPAATLFTTPTVNGYKRFRPYSLAPDRIVWGEDNRGALVRVIGAPGEPATRLENRGGEPAANPYLYVASQVVSGLDGIDRGVDPGPPTSEPHTVDAPRLPQSILAAVDALERDDLFRKRLGDDFLDHYLAIKRFEIDRFLGAVTDWEQREYLDLF